METIRSLKHRFELELHGTKSQKAFITEGVVFLLSASWRKKPSAAQGPVIGSSAAMGMATSIKKIALWEL
jgi:hypothetical protein